MLEDYQTTKEAARRLHVDESRVRQLCIDERLPGAVKVGRQWLIPKHSWPQSTGFGRPPRWKDYMLEDLPGFLATWSDDQLETHLDEVIWSGAPEAIEIWGQEMRKRGMGDLFEYKLQESRGSGVVRNQSKAGGL